MLSTYSATAVTSILVADITNVCMMMIMMMMMMMMIIIIIIISSSSSSSSSSRSCDVSRAREYVFYVFFRFQKMTFYVFLK